MKIVSTYLCIKARISSPRGNGKKSECVDQYVLLPSSQWHHYNCFIVIVCVEFDLYYAYYDILQFCAMQSYICVMEIIYLGNILIGHCNSGKSSTNNNIFKTPYMQLYHIWCGGKTRVYKNMESKVYADFL